MASRFERLGALRQLSVYSWTTRTALRHITVIPELKDLFLNGLRHPGRLERWGEMAALEHLNVYGATANDLRAVLAAPRLRTLTSHSVELDEACIAVLAAKPGLRAVDLERAVLDDAGLRVLASSPSITSLTVPATNITAAGLRWVAEMRQLRELDIWATDHTADDLAILADLPRLEFLSVGGYDGQLRLTAEAVIPRLHALPALKRIWLDGIPLTTAQKVARGSATPS